MIHIVQKWGNKKSPDLWEWIFIIVIVTLFIWAIFRQS